MTLDPFFWPRSVALVGAAHTELKLGGVILKNLLRFKGDLYPINPKYRELMGRKAYPEVKEVPGPFDLAIIMRPAPEVPEIVASLKGKTRSALVMSSGFAEIGEVGLQERVARAGRDAGIRILGPNCMGIYNPHAGLDTFFLPRDRLRRPKKGNLAIVSQSGAILSCLLTAVVSANMGVSRVVGYGNAADIDESDILSYLANDRHTEVVIAYIESLGDGRKFIGEAKRLSERKSLLVLKSGKFESGQAAAYSHTGRLAGRYEVFHSILKRFGLREAEDLDELLDATKALSYQKARSGNRVCIVTNGGGSGVLAADECVRQGLTVPMVSDAARERLRGIFPPFYGMNNPIDLTAQVRDEEYLAALIEVAGEYDGFVVIALPNVFGITGELAARIEEGRTRIGKPVAVHIPPGGISRRIISLLEKSRIPVYPSPERAVRGLKALLTG